VSFDAALISDAIVVWTGRGTRAWPDRREGRLVEAFGADAAAQLIAVVRSLAQEFSRSDAAFTVPDLAEAGDVAAAQFRRVHPDLSEEAVQALAWCYTYDNK
jgi:hypothetical protein